MCGIAGIVDLNNKPVKQEHLTEMIKLMKHRGPDDEGIFIDNHIGLGFVRLSIIDLSSAGHQPMQSRDKRYTIIFNGEIYNYKELRTELSDLGVKFSNNTDTEVLLNAYILWGEECMHKFNGMWAFVIYDSLEKSLFASRDRYGVKPFYYTQTSNAFIFCSEIPPLLHARKQPTSPNNQVMFDYLVFNRTDQTEETFFAGISKLQHGCKLLYKNGKITISKWYDLKKEISKAKGFETPEEYKQLLKSSIELRLRSDVKVGVCLSGGLDSSSIVSMITDFELENDINTFSAVYKKDQIGDESEFIHEFRSKVKNMHFTTPTSDGLEHDLMNYIKTQSEPVPTTSAYAEYKVMQLAKGKCVVILNGQGADEALAGYHYFFGFYFLELFRKLRWIKLSSELIHYVRNHKSLYGIKSFLYFLTPSALKTSLRLNEKRYLVHEFAETYSKSNSIAGKLYDSKSLKDALVDHFEFKLEHLLKWDDRNSMTHSLESRAPFLDYRLVERTLSTKNDLIIYKGSTKFILREALKGILPEKIRKRKDKVGYATPEDEWFRESNWDKIVTDILRSDSFRKRKIVNADLAMQLYQKHKSKQINISKEIWKWVNIELWFREYIDTAVNDQRAANQPKVCTLGVWDDTIPGIVFNERGESNYAGLFHRLTEEFPRKENGKQNWKNIMNKIKTNGKGKPYDCIIGVSGGTDSCYLLHLAKEAGLRPLAVHLDNGWNSEIAVANIEKLTRKLNIDLRTYVINYDEIKDLLRSYMHAGMPWIDMPTDLAIKAILYKIAAQENIKYVLRGNDFRTEGTQPKEWTYGDGRQLLAIHKKHGSVKLKTYPNYTIFNLFYCALIKQIKSVYPYYYVDYNKSKAKQFLEETYGWMYYGGHHHENLFTKFAISYWLPVKFNIDKRKITYSALVMSGEMSRNEALALLAQPPYNLSGIDETISYVRKKLDLSKEEFDKIMSNTNRSYKDFPSYNYILQKVIRLGKPFLKLLFIHKPQSVFQAEMRKDLQ